ncbi:PTS system, fructose subfamily, IIA component [Halobacteroides halobius DSM 5150]|uniref:PTS system, fructose subfamily, IIA component n=1 Tax=Halobacteroides halobius (strain ATCC 35273 / DSM 5150 / MD-1) TaxID=748449 RepID=L0K7X5_HALHC|nr:PTS sugar transporter subunit IIA [Halobacteroides halobius]AGB40454.1 PTS system, fructose subfamily, IIA component [Halobacteroides halobius DSM 5150]
MNDLINEELISLDVVKGDKQEIIKSLASLIDKSGRLESLDKYYDSLLTREEKSSTGIGNQIAIPHGKSSSVKEPTVAFARLKEGVDWEAIDDQSVKLIFLLAIPEESKSDDHLKILATLSRNLLNDGFKEELLNVQTKEEVNKILTQMF